MLRLGNILEWFNQAREIGTLVMLANDAKTLCTYGYKCITPIIQTRQIAHLDHCPYWIRLLIEMLALWTRKHNTKWSIFTLTINYHLTITHLKDVQRRHGSRKEHYI